MNLQKFLSVAFLVPMHDPREPSCQWGLPVMLWGDPGIGKSSQVSAAAFAVGLPPQVVYAATSQPEDVSGTAFPDGKGGLTILSLLPGIRRLIANAFGVLFLDELTCARPAVQAAFLAVPLTRRIGDQDLPPGIRVLAAGNPPDSAAGGWELEPPMANRFCHVDFKCPSVPEWTSWLLNGNAKMPAIEQGEARIRENWPNVWPTVQGLVAGFLTTSPSLLHEMPPDGNPNRGRAWPSPRTWEFAARAYATCMCLGVGHNKPLIDKNGKTDGGDEVRMAFVEGCVGDGAATAFAAWVKNADLPDPLTVLREGWTIDKARLDRCFAVYTSIIAYTTGRTDQTEREELAVLAWNRLEESMNANLLDITLPMANTLVKAGLDSKSTTAVAAAAHPVMLRLAKMGMAKYLPGTR